MASALHAKRRAPAFHPSPRLAGSQIVFGLAGNLALVFVALPMAVNAVVDYKADVAEQSEYSRAHAAVTREMVLTLLNEQRAEEGLPPATHLLCDDTVHDDHHDAGRSALADFDAIWCQVEESMASQAEAPPHPATGER